ncbi:MAG: Asp23/Gls24 family envelope stress response protein [Actinobacteria bacterium]|nr:Asp23/Gls24 family envelope stress response protein [Actinomycetota bacterium]
MSEARDTERIPSGGLLDPRPEPDPEPERAPDRDQDSERGTTTESTPPAAPPTSPLVTSRGTTSISSGVVEKVSKRAAAEVEGVSGVTSSGIRGLLDLVRPPSPAEDGVDAKADVGKETAAIDLSVRIRYPRPAARVAEEVRRHVMRRVQEMTGLVVTEVNVEIPEFALDRDVPRVRVR